MNYNHNNLIIFPQNRKEEVYVIGGGTSLKNKNFQYFRDKDTIAINKSVFNIPYPNYFITMDVTFLKKIQRQIKYFRKSTVNKIFILNLGNPNIKERDGKIIDIRWNYIYDMSDFDIIIKSYNRTGIGFYLNDFRNGANSGYCGLQLAIILGYKKINLLGIDMNVSDRLTHFHEGYGEHRKLFQKKLDKYYEFFKIGLQQIKDIRPDIQIYSCSETSKLNQILPYKKL